MSEDSNVTLMDTSPGGENTQYESINTTNNTHAKEEGQFGHSNTDGLIEDKLEQSEQEGQKAKNLRYEESMSKREFDGETMGSSGHAQQRGYGRIKEQKVVGDINHTREEQQYEKGSNIGA